MDKNLLFPFLALLQDIFQRNNKNVSKFISRLYFNQSADLKIVNFQHSFPTRFYTDTLHYFRRKLILDLYSTICAVCRGLYTNKADPVIATATNLIISVESCLRTAKTWSSLFIGIYCFWQALTFVHTLFTFLIYPCRYYTSQL